MTDGLSADEFLRNARSVFEITLEMWNHWNAQQWDTPFPPDAWQREQPRFTRLCDQLADLAGAIRLPPEGLEPVAAYLRKLAETVRTIQGQMATPSGQQNADYLEFCPELASAAYNGQEAIKAIEGSKRTRDQFEFLDPGSSTIVKTAGSPEMGIRLAPQVIAQQPTANADAARIPAASLLPGMNGMKDWDGFKALVPDIFALWQELSSQHPVPAAESARRFIDKMTGRMFFQGWEFQYQRHGTICPPNSGAQPQPQLAVAEDEIVERLVRFVMDAQADATRSGRPGL